MNFIDWNNRIGRHLFNADRAGSRVFFFVTEDLLNQIGAESNVDKDDFLAAVKSGPPWNTRQTRGICQQALQAFEDWRTREYEYPPYLCYLALFVWADSIDAGFARHAYYPGLRSLLGEHPESGMYPSFNQMYRLWDDLATWSNIDKHGELGVFHADIAGEWMHVGLPRAQTLLTDRERDKLPLIFAENGLDPLDPPGDSELIFLLTEDPHHYLRPHTKQLLTSTTERDAPIRSLLIDACLSELEDWDNSTPENNGSIAAVGGLLATLRLCMTLDATARTARFFLRCRSNRSYPEEGLFLRGDASVDALVCSQDWQGWSTLLFTTGKGKGPFDAASLDWSHGASFVDHDQKWNSILPKRPVRVMINAKRFGFDGFVEQSQLPSNEKFHLLVHDTSIALVRTWGQTECNGFSEVLSFSGLPNQWSLFVVERAQSDRTIRDALPYLAFSSELRIKLGGGLKIRGTRYFDFSLPNIELTGPQFNVQVLCNGIPLNQQEEGRVYNIPPNLSSQRMIVEVYDKDVNLGRKTIYAVKKTDWQQNPPPLSLNKFGVQTIGEAEMCVGLDIRGFSAPPFIAQSPRPSSKHRVYYIGKNSGEIAEYPKEDLSMDWQPIWIVTMNKGLGHAIYCGVNISDEQPRIIPGVNGKRIRLWRKILWQKRRRISHPTRPVLNTLWIKYRNAARNV